MSNDIDNDNICRRALKAFGYEHQRLMLMEETAELQNALCKMARGRCTRADVITEIADCWVMLRQMTLHFGQRAVAAETCRKLARLDKRLKALEQIEQHTRETD